jgi:serine/threonine protein kinase
LADLGLAQYLGEEDDGEYIGGNTPAYMDYEKLDEQSDSKKADIWAIGVLWRQLLILPNQLDLQLAEYFSMNNQFNDINKRKEFIQRRANMNDSKCQNQFLDILSQILHPTREQRLSAGSLKQKLDEISKMVVSEEQF